MRSSETILAFSSKVPGFYEPIELDRLLELTRSLPSTATIVEVGVEYGRSTSIFLQCPENWSELHLIDDRSVNGVAGRQWTSWLLGRFQSLGAFGERAWDAPTPFEAPSTHDRRPRALGTNRMPDNMIYDLEISSEYGATRVCGPIDLLHIDADHGPAIWNDCLWWLPKVRVGGYAVFHDYARKGADGEGDVFPEVTRAVDHYINHHQHGGLSLPVSYRTTGQWEPLSVIDTQFAARRIA